MILGCRYRLTIGSVVILPITIKFREWEPARHVQQPIRILREATRAEYVEHIQLAAGDPHLPESVIIDDPYYYEIQTD
jgi:hypothetical protein